MKTKNMPDNVSSLLTRSRNGRILKSCRTAEQSCNAESDESSGEKHGEDISVDDDSIESNDVNKEEDQRKVYTNFSSESLHLPNPDQSFEYERRKEKSKKAYVNPKRFRGFSTSVKALFLDETVVCSAISCFGLLASSRSEHFLSKRNERKGLTNWNRTPSMVLSIALVLTIFSLLITYVIYGFDKNPAMDDATNEYDYGYRKLEFSTNSTIIAKTAKVRDKKSALVDFRKKKYGFNGINQYRDYESNFLLPFKEFVIQELFTRDRRPSTIGIGFNGNTFNHVTSDRILEDYYAAANDDVDDYLDDVNDDEGNDVNEYYNDDKGYAVNDDYSDSTGKTDYDDSAAIIARNIRTLICVLFFVILGIVGRRRRMRTRFSIVKARTQDDQLQFNASKKHERRSRSRSRARREDRGEDKYAGACSHTILGCYPIDLAEDNYHDDEHDTRKYSDFSQRMFNYISSLCCGVCCKNWIQCCSICALAQEAREVRLFLPPKEQRIDFITHQPFHEYFKDIYLIRSSWKGRITAAGWSPHFRALSTLSRWILLVFSFTSIIIFLTARLNARAQFSFGDACVLIATFLQSLIVLGVVHGIFHKSDLSLDAAIKFFAAGFVIAAPISFVFEGIAINLILIVSYFSKSFLGLIAGEAFIDWIETHYAVFMYISGAISSFLVAASIEEFCKYYAFRMIEYVGIVFSCTILKELFIASNRILLSFLVNTLIRHPDLIFLTGLNRSNEATREYIGGSKGYPYCSHITSATSITMNRRDSFEDLQSQTSFSENQHRGMSKESQKISKLHSDKFVNEEFDEDEIRTLRQRAAAVTTAVISCAVGLACAENFIYVFVFRQVGVSNTQEQLTILLCRSIFPVHALCGAMQSIGLIRKFLEKEQKTHLGVGKIVLPAIILHGSFDSILMFLDSYIDVAWQNYDMADNPDELPYDAFAVNATGGLSLVGVMMFGGLWYYKRKIQQSKTLKLQDEAVSISTQSSTKHEDESDGTYVNPEYAIFSHSPKGEIELL